MMDVESDIDISWINIVIGKDPVNNKIKIRGDLYDGVSTPFEFHPGFEQRYDTPSEAIVALRQRAHDIIGCLGNVSEDFLSPAGSNNLRAAEKISDMFSMEDPI